MKRLIRNVIKCNRCGDVIESFSRHDFKYCSCGSVFVDGGLDYARRGFKNNAIDDYEELSEWEDVEDEEEPSEWEEIDDIEEEDEPVNDTYEFLSE